ncbi:hypothetical protein NGM99_18255 [Mesorhizobium sp. RP14(2022)]|uniref:Uncharacterized protein n=1 Tax=Mesorhizobium liriopis TaxID=2953882 RepID=A0ABT1CA85_9HYPH|nr:hypothetical protein [Mesorhizobium liriopis]MCO6051732.1 hypothetical protein [Mesorhizobium liriopis]
MMHDRGSAATYLTAIVDHVMDFEPDRVERALNLLLPRTMVSERGRRAHLLSLLREISELDPEHPANHSIRNEAYVCIEHARRIVPPLRKQGQGGSPHAQWWVAVGAIGTLLLSLALFGPH